MPPPPRHSARCSRSHYCYRSSNGGHLHCQLGKTQRDGAFAASPCPLTDCPTGAKFMPYWLMKSEPDELSIHDLQRLEQARWDGVRNYQARNFVRSMQPGDRSSSTTPAAQNRALPGSPASSRRTTPTQRPWSLTAITSTPRPAPPRTLGAPSMWPLSRPSNRSFRWPS